MSLQGDDRWLCNADKSCQLALGKSPVTSKSGETLPERRSRGQVSSDKLKTKMRERCPPGPEVPLSVLKQPHGLLGEADLGGKLPLGQTLSSAPGLKVFPKPGIGRKFAHSTAFRYQIR